MNKNRVIPLLFALLALFVWIAAEWLTRLALGAWFLLAGVYEDD